MSNIWWRNTSAWPPCTMDCTYDVILRDKGIFSLHYKICLSGKLNIASVTLIRAISVSIEIMLLTISLQEPHVSTSPHLICSCKIPSLSLLISPFFTGVIIGCQIFLFLHLVIYSLSFSSLCIIMLKHTKYLKIV